MLSSIRSSLGILLPSPLKPLPRPFIPGADIWLKRDDLIHPEISGNKWRKLQFYLLIALESKATGLASAGGPHSQHLLAVACAGQALGLKTKGFVRGIHKEENALLARCRALGMDLVFVENGAFRQTFQAPEFEPELPELWAYIPMGGAGLHAMPGIAACWQEVQEQQNLQKGSTGFDAIAVSAGTGTFAAGMLRATQGTGIRIWVFPAFRPDASFQADVLRLAQVSEEEAVRLSIHYRPEQGRFGQVPEVIRAFANDFKNDHGIALEPIYEAKMLYGLTQLLAEENSLADKKILAVLAGAPQ